jgi:membrane protein
LAYYTIFSMAPVLLIAIGMGSMILGQDAARGGVVDEVRDLMGDATADAAAAFVDNANQEEASTRATVIGLVTLLIGASGVFAALQEALNRIWKVQAPPQTGSAIVHFIRNRLLSFAAVLATGLLLLASVVASSILAAIAHWAKASALPGTTNVWFLLSTACSFAIITLMFALIFKLLPDTPVRWRDVWIGALLTALLFSLGQHAIGFYLGQSSVASTYGAAGTLVALLVWVYYSAQIVLFGAEFTHEFAMGCGSQSKESGALIMAAPAPQYRPPSRARHNTQS